MDRVQGPGRRIGNDLRRPGPAFQRGRTNREANHRAAGCQRSAECRNRNTGKARLRPDPWRNPFIGQRLRDETGTDNADSDARQKKDKFRDAGARALTDQHAPPTGCNKCQDPDGQPQKNIDGERHFDVSRYSKPARTTSRASKPAIIGKGSASMMRQMTKSEPKKGSSQTKARVYPMSVQLTMKATTAPASAPMTRKAPATG